MLGGSIFVKLDFGLENLIGITQVVVDLSLKLRRLGFLLGRWLLWQLLLRIVRLLLWPVRLLVLALRVHVLLRLLPGQRWKLATVLRGGLLRLKNLFSRGVRQTSNCFGVV